MRTIWGAELLARCTGLNSIFFRSRNKSEWAKIPLLLRQEMEEFCYSRLRALVEALSPKQVVFIGLSSFDRFVDNSSVALSLD